MDVLYEQVDLEQLRIECTNREIAYSSKDGKRNLISKLKVYDKATAQDESIHVDFNLEHDVNDPSSINDVNDPLESSSIKDSGNVLNFKEQVELIQLQREIRREEEERKIREEERMRKRREEEEEREIRRREEEEEREIRMIERRLHLKKEEEELRMRANEESVVESKPHRHTFLKIREMREGEDIEDYFRVFEMTARAQFLPESEWLGSLVPKLSEKAKAVYLEIPDDKAQNYKATKDIIFEAYQHTVDYYRFKFRNSDKGLEEDFVQWNNRSRRYLDRWMRVAKSKGSEERVLEQILIEKMLDSVSPELRSWLIERKPETSGELARLANEHVQAKKGPLVDGKYVGNGKKTLTHKSKFTVNERTATQDNFTSNATTQEHNIKLRQPRGRDSIRCYSCGKNGHLSYDCKEKRKTTTGLLCMTPLESEQDIEFKPHGILGYIGDKAAKMLVDSGCTRTLIHHKFATDTETTGDYISVLTASGERITVPLAWVTIVSDQGKHTELVGIMKSLPVDVLLGRSSFGQTLTRTDVLAQWETNLQRLEDMKERSGDAFVLTRSQVALQKAQEKRDELIDRESKVAVKSLAPASNNTKNLIDKVSTQQVMSVDEIHSEPHEQSRNEMRDDCKHVLDRNHEQLMEDQKSDVTLKSIYDSAQEKPCEDSDCYFIQHGILMNRKYTKNEHNGMNYTDRVVIPEFYRQEILRLGHSTPIAGHMGQEKTHSRIASHFYWPKLHFDVKKFCATCPECQLVSRKKVASRAPLRPVPVVSEPFRKIAIDIIGELPRSKSGCKYILTIVDYATRYPEAIPLKNISSKTVADALIQCFTRVGIPDELVSDQGSNFLSTLMKQMYEHLGITKIQTSVYHPEANGLVERFNGTLKTMLRKFVSESVQDWDKYLPYLLFAYREVPCESTGYSPFELLYGRTPRGPMAIIKENWLETPSSEQNLVSHVLEMRRRLALMQKNVVENLTASQAKQKRLYDRKSTTRRFKTGDKVLVLLPTPGSKLETKWQGPHVITQVKDDGRSYEVDTGNRKKRHRTYYVNLLKKWQDRDDVAALAIPEPVADSLPCHRSLLQTDAESWEDVKINEQLTKQEHKGVTEILETFSDVLSGIPDRTTAAVHNIDTGDAEPIRSTPYKVPQTLENQVSDEIDKMLAMGVVRPSKSPWASPVVIVPKPDKTLRFCVDYRKLNRVTKMDAYPIPRLDRIVERVAAASYITTLDLTKGYWQIPLAEEAIEKSAIIASNSLFEFTVMPFGMKTAPATFQRMMSEVVLKGLEEFSNAYIDDVAIDTSKSLEHHLQCLQRILLRLREFNLRARPTKCKVAMPVTDFMGHKVGSKEIHPKEVLVRAIDRYPTPLTKKQVRSFLGLVGYYRKFIPNFAQRALALTDLTKGSCPTKVKWTDDCEVSFQDLKQAMKEQPVLVPPQWEKEFVLQVDASQRGLGAVLSQKLGEDEEHPIAFASRKLQPSEEKLSTTEKECLAIVWGVEHFKYYLWGRPFTLQTDHNPLVWLGQVKDKNQKLLRWSITLQEYTMKINHKQGIKNTNADALSRA